MTGQGSISVIIPALNEEAALPLTLQSIEQVSGVVEVIVVDGGSTDHTCGVAERHGARVLSGPRGRGSQMAAGATIATGDVFWFLHADTTPRSDVGPAILRAVCSGNCVGGSFRLQFDGVSRAARFLTWLYPHLSLLGLSYGDAGLFTTREAYLAAGGFRDHPLFEDLDLIRRLQRTGRLARLDTPLMTSSRRFEGRSFAGVFAWWTLLQVLFWLRVPPRALARLYPAIRAPATRPTATAKVL